MENQLQRMNNTPAFLTDAVSSLQKMEAYAALLIKSGLLPKHFYQTDQYRNILKDQQGNPVGNVPAVIMTIQHGMEIGMSISQALQQIVPINGVVSVKGDGAMALIQNSGLCVSWKEEITGTIEKEDYKVKLSAKHKNGREKVIEFSVEDAKRLGLWVTPDMVAKNDKLRHGGWWKVPKRMINYRALGYMARDLFPEVMQGMYVEEEARDFEEDNTVMTTQEGMTVKITGDTKGTAMNNAALAAIGAAETPLVEKKAPRKAVAKPADPVQQPTVDTEAEVMTDEQPEVKQETPTKYSKETLAGMTPQEVLKLANEVLGFDVNTELYTTDEYKKKRTKPMLMKMIMAKQDGILDGLLMNEFNYTVKTETQPSEQSAPPTAESPANEQKTGTQDAPEGGRDFDACMDIQDQLTELGVGETEIMEFVAANNIDVADYEAFFAFAPGGMIDKLINEYSA